jgi:all-beta uncharacterized protein
VIKLSACLAAAILSAACGGGSPSTPSAGGADDPNTSQIGTCRFSVPADTVRQTTDAGEKDIRIPVTASTGCSWTAASQASFITVTDGATGTASAPVTLHVAANDGGQRQGQLVVAAIAITITQQPLPCAFALSGDTDRSFGPAGGTGSITITVTQGVNCGWSATTSAAFVRITSAASGTGSGVVTFAVDANTGAPRTATLTVAGQAVTVTQQAAGTLPGCLFSVVPTQVSVGFAGGNTTLVVTDEGGPACAWDVTSNAPFLTIGAITHTSETRSEVVVTAAANTAAARSGTVTISNARLSATVTFSQADGIAGTACAFSVSPTTVSVAAAGGTVTVVVVDDGGPACSWDVTSNAPFTTVGAIVHTSDTRSEVTLNVASNSGAARTAMVGISNPRMRVTIAIVQAGS